MKRKTSIIILTYNHLDYTKACIESILKYTKEGTYEIIVVDNCSTDETRKWLKEQSYLKVILNDENLGFPKGCNKGIKAACKENDILLLNNDTIVTTNWLDNLKKCLYSNEKIGAVGAISNHQENLQGCDFTYDNFEQMQKLAARNNISDSKRWEEKVFLIGFCILIKKEVMEKIKYLDESYTPGYIEDNDLSLQILKAGYKLFLCHDAFIHHYLGTEFRKDLNAFYPILNKNRKYFEKKFGFQTFAFDEIKQASLKLVEDPPTKILDINCGIGANLLKMKYLFKDVKIQGVEKDKKKIEIAKFFAPIYSNINQVKEHDFDYIFIGNALELEKNPSLFLKKIKKLLKKDGYIIGECKNIASIEHIKSLIQESWYFTHQENLHYYTKLDIEKLFLEQSYRNGFFFSWITYLNDFDKQMVEKLNEIITKPYDISYYSFRYQK